MKKKHEALTVPNLLSFFRIALIPIFAIVYLRAERPEDFYLAGALIALSGMTDLLDGKIARRFQQVTELGKFLDPLADKLTQGVMVLCMAGRFPMMWVLVAIFVVKEGFMSVAGLLLLRRGKKLDGAKWFGKVCTAIQYLIIFFLLLDSDLSIATANAAILLCGGVMLVTLALYIPEFHRLFRD